MRNRKSRVAAVLPLIFAITFGRAVGDSIPSIRDTVISMPTEQPSFSFRGGITWGMNQQEVREKENIPMQERISGEWSVMVTDQPAVVSRFTADLVFIFQQNALRMITYEFQKETSKLNYQYLTGALSSVYGESEPAEKTTIKGLMDLIYPDRYRLDWIQNALMWKAQDGTTVFLYYFSGQAYAILYACPELGKQNYGYAVNGL